MSLVPFVKNLEDARRAIQKLARKLGSTSRPTFIGIVLSGLTQGSILFVGADGVLSQNNSNLFWDDANNRLGIGTASPDKPLEIRNSTPVIRLRATGSYVDAAAPYVEFGGDNAGAWKRTGYVGDATSGDTDIYLRAEVSNLKLGDSTSNSVLTLSGGDAIFTQSINVGTSGKIYFRDTDISISSILTDGILDITADFSIDLFFDNADVGDEADGQSLNINRRAAEGDDYISLYVDKDRRGLIGFSGDNDLLQLTADFLTVAGTVKNTGGRITKRTSVTSSPYNILVSDNHISVTTTSVAITLNLPAIVDGTVYHIKDQDENAFGNNITITPDGSDTIENAASLVISANGTCITIIGNSTTNNWEIQ